MDNLPPLGPAEANYRQKGLLKEDERLACQVTLKGDICIEVPPQNKFPHITYSY